MSGDLRSPEWTRRRERAQAATQDATASPDDPEQLAGMNKATAEDQAGQDPGEFDAATYAEDVRERVRRYMRPDDPLKGLLFGGGDENAQAAWMRSYRRHNHVSIDPRTGERTWRRG